jgi:mannose-1-phosphate guanylyltransferase/mannose-6-phosphate isomerase
MIVPVILSGGSGTRLWPLSRSAYPKQFLPLVSDATLFQETIARLSGLEDCAQPLVVCNEGHRFLVAEQLRQQEINPAAIMLEPVGRNTAPAVACAALFAQGLDPDAVLLVMPSDHVIQKPAVFQQAVVKGTEAAGQGKLVTFGIVASRPETGYGYIRKSGPDQEFAKGVSPVAEFVEKPDLETARKYVESGDYFWNSGMFVFRADAYLNELERCFPEIIESCRRAYKGREPDRDFLRLEKELFAACPAESIDYAVMEKTSEAVVVPLDAGWSDVGSWSSLSEVVENDQGGNVVAGDVLAKDVKNSYLRSETRLVAGIGLENLVVVETADAVLVADKSRVEEVKGLVEEIRAGGRCEHLHHVRVYRPWGNYQTVDESDRFQVKRIVVNPGASLSLQMHHHRAEHWVVVKGTAKVTRGDEEITLTEDQSVYVPLGTKHRLVNPGLIPLELIEVQTGSYLGEDDIVRFEDVYGREKE